jgi:DNA-directed RNA polymerase subunit N (RpoN/RPB10)
MAKKASAPVVEESVVESVLTREQFVTAYINAVESESNWDKLADELGMTKSTCQQRVQNYKKALSQEGFTAEEIEICFPSFKHRSPRNAADKESFLALMRERIEAAKAASTPATKGKK